jgi:hypothetical protein
MGYGNGESMLGKGYKQLCYQDFQGGFQINPTLNKYQVSLSPTYKNKNGKVLNLAIFILGDIVICITLKYSVL